ncbi:MAG: VanZ family protein [Acidobacteria bacterium]|nr:VanZ family protein [Acidobacteriota bacterium]
MNFLETRIFNRNYTVLTVAYCAFLFYLSAQSTLPLPQYFSWQDLLEHAAAYFVLGILVRRAAPFASFRLLLAFIVFYGMSDEIHQYFVPGRVCDILDLVADATGGTIALLFHRQLFSGLRAGTTNERGAP